AADDVVLAKAAEDDVAAASALDVVLPVRCGLERRVHRQRPERVVGVAGCAEGADGVAAEEAVDRAVALDRVVAELAEDHVVAAPAGDVVGAEAREARARLEAGL